MADGVIKKLQEIPQLLDYLEERTKEITEDERKSVGLSIIKKYRRFYEAFNEGASLVLSLHEDNEFLTGYVYKLGEAYKELTWLAEKLRRKDIFLGRR